MAAEFSCRFLAPPNKQVAGKIGEYEFLFDFNDELQRQMYFGLYDLQEITLLKKALRPGEVFLDIGANVGYYSLIASSLVGYKGQVHAFEPIPENANKITTALGRNGISNVRVNQVAVGDKDGTFVFYVGNAELSNSGWASIVPSKRRPCTLTVPKISIDRYLYDNEINSVSFLKIDVEGAEPDAIAGMSSLLEQNVAPDIIC
jgi:FkbM family methyltransferase